MIIWFATGNVHKKAELAAALPEHTVKIPADEGIVFEADETGADFMDNALIKARALYRLLRGRGGVVVADDSGLCVDALGGRPGVRSARYRGPDGEDGTGALSAAERNTLLLEELRRLEEAGERPDRRARFVCAMVLLLDEYCFRAAQETLEGEVVRTAAGSGGFGYDPLLYLPDRRCTVAELPAEEKNRISHRGKAGRVLGQFVAQIAPDGCRNGRGKFG